MFPYIEDTGFIASEIAKALSFQNSHHTAMQPIDLDSIYRMGKKLSLLEYVREGMTGDRLRSVLTSATEIAEKLGDEEEFKLTVCEPALKKLLGILHQYVEFTEDENGPWPIFFPPPDFKIKKFQAEQISKAYSEFETIFTAEIRKLHSYLLPQVGIYSMDVLISGAEVGFDEETLGKFPPGTVDDLRDAGKCIAFDLPTAAGFHILRATEAVMYAYLSELGHEVKPKSRNWGAYVRLLEKDPNADPNIARTIENVRVAHRNPIMHPEQKLDIIADAIILKGICDSLIAMMAKKLRQYGTSIAVTEFTDHNKNGNAGVSAPALPKN